MRTDSVRITAPATIVAGAVILTESIRSIGLSQVEVSVRDILHGAAR